VKPFKAWLPSSSQSAEVILQGERVRLRPAHEEDWVQWTAVRRANQDLLCPLEPKWPADALTQAFFMRRLTLLRREWQEGRACSFLIWRTSGELIGGFNLNHVCRGAAQSATLGYWLAQEWQGQGLMTEAARLAADFAFGPFLLHRLNAATLTHNLRSQALLKRLGFVEEGFARRYIQIDGIWQDHNLYGLNAEDWGQKER
jgi:ribosomal-protein-alanine N-acetyltransferase